MFLLERFWAMTMSLMNIISLSPFQDNMIDQSLLRLPSQNHTDLTGPTFDAPGSHGPDAFKCEYPSMVGWEPCSTPTSRGCWLRQTSESKKKDTILQYDTSTNYENERPLGITRNYTLELNDGLWDADGLSFTAAKLFNDVYPGPWIQACWGDT